MAFALQTKRISGNGNVTFDFSSAGQGNIGAFVYGMQQLFLQNGSPGAVLQNFGVSYNVAPGTGIGYSSVTLVQQLASGMDTANSWCDVTVLAWLGGQNPPGIFLTNGSPISVGQTGNPIAVGYQPIVSAAVLGGFDLNFASNNSDLLGWGASAGVTAVPNGAGPQVATVVSASLIGDSAFSGTVDGGLIVLTSAQPGIAFAVVSSLNSTGTVTQPVGSATITGAAILLQSFYAQFDISSDPTPDLVSLQVGASNVTAGNGDGNVHGTIGVNFQGEISGNATPYSNGPTSAAVTNTCATYLVVALTS